MKTKKPSCEKPGFDHSSRRGLSCAEPGVSPLDRRNSLRAPARAPALGAAIARAVSRHNRAADMACGGVAEIDNFFQRVGGVDYTGGGRTLLGDAGHRRLATRNCFFRTWAKAFEQRLLLAFEELDVEPAEDIVHDRFGEPDVAVRRPAAGLETRVRELFAQQLQRYTVLQRHRNCEREAIHQARDGR